jgi:hypothetical protein
LIGLELADEALYGIPERQALQRVLQGFIGIAADILFVNRIQVTDAGFGQIVHQTHPDQPTAIHIGFFLGHNEGDKGGAVSVFGHGFFSGPEKAKTGPGDFFQHSGLKQQIGYLAHVYSLFLSIKIENLNVY